MVVVATGKTGVYRNLALEERLLDHAPRLPVLFLYVNAPCVVIGKNQNPWRECRLSLMQTEGVALARRISGGGAVYHDEGNLNVSVIVQRTRYDAEKVYRLMEQALEPFGIFPERLNKNSLAVQGRKFSGHAFCHRRDRTLHHGTLLVGSRLDRLKRYLGCEIEGIETKAVASVPSEVMNLREVSPELTVETLSAALAENFRRLYGAECEIHPSPEASEDKLRDADEELESGIRRNASDEWIYGQTPRFEVNRPGGRLTVEKGRIVNMDGMLPFEEWRKNDAADI